MKIEVDLMDNGIPYLWQLEAVCNYITTNTDNTIKHNFFGEICKKGDIPLYEVKTIKETKKDTAEKISVGDKRFHVMCSKTKSGAYKFKVWQSA